MLALASSLHADREAPITPERLIEQSDLVIQGKVKSVTKVKEESIASEKADQKPVILEHYDAVIDIGKFEKKSNTLSNYQKSTVIVSFKVTTDPRYKGEVIPKLEQGQKYIFYGRTIRMDKDGGAVIFLNSSKELQKLDPNK